MTAHTTAATTAPTFAQSVWLVAEREIGSKLRSKSVLISFGILFVLALAGVIWAGFSAQSASTTPVAVTSESARYVDGVPGLEVTEVAAALDEQRVEEEPPRRVGERLEYEVVVHVHDDR